MHGDILTKLQRFDEAAVAYDSAIERRMSGPLLVRRYLALRAAGVQSGLLRPLEDWVADNPEDYPTRRTLAAAYLDAGSPTAATRLYEELAAFRENDPVVLNNLASLYFEAGDPRALETAEAAFRLAPKQSQTLDTLGWIHVQTGDTARGLELLRDAFARESRRLSVRYHLAVALSRQGKNMEAREHLEAILSAETVSDEVAQKSKQLLAELKGG